MQDPDKVKLADVFPTTKEVLKIFLSEKKIEQCTIDGHSLRTLEDAILFAVQEARRVPKLEKENEELRAIKVKNWRFTEKRD